MHGILLAIAIGVVKTSPEIKLIVRSLVSPYKVVKVFHLAFTSLLIIFAIPVASAGALRAPGHVTSTTSITRVSTATAAVNPNEEKPITKTRNTCTLLFIRVL